MGRQGARLAERGHSGQEGENKYNECTHRTNKGQKGKRSGGDKSNKLNSGAERQAENNYEGDVVAITEGCTSAREGFGRGLARHPASGQGREKKAADALHQRELSGTRTVQIFRRSEGSGLRLQRLGGSAAHLSSVHCPGFQTDGSVESSDGGQTEGITYL